MTKKLWDDDVYCAESDASIQYIKKNGQFHVVLDQTAFYPEGGGQPSDAGSIDGYPVEYVYEEQGEVYHIMRKKPQMAARDRRFHFMQQHLGQHILTAVFVEQFNANTVGLRFGEEIATIEFDRHETDSQANQMEQIANATIYQNIPVEILYPSMEEILRNSKRKIPQTDEEIRIVKIGELDYTPCCGTHTTMTGEVGIIKIFNNEAGKNGSKITFACGRAALNHFIIVGTNKIVSDVEEADRRIKMYAAPMNNKKYELPNPCVKLGECMDCKSPQRICNITTVISRRPPLSDIHIVVLGEKLGF